MSGRSRSCVSRQDAKPPRVDDRGGKRPSDVSSMDRKSGRPDSNRRRPAWEAGILPTELRPRTTYRAAEPSIAKLPPLRRSATPPHDREPQVRIELTTARLRIGCSTTELLWRREDALARTRTATPFGTTPSRWRVYQFHHQGMPARYGTFSCAAPPSCVLHVHGADGARTRDLSSDSRVL